jgi:flagellar L-ring protein precursor FlgH
VLSKRTKSIVPALLLALLAGPAAPADKKKKAVNSSALDAYVKDAMQRDAATEGNASGSLWSPSSRLADLGRDLRASQVDDLVTVVVAENASAVSTGTVKTARTSSANNSVASLAGVKSATGALANLANVSGSSALDGQGTTTRTTTLSTTLTARVTRQLPNGYLVVEGSKVVFVNGERQTVTIRGVIRSADLAADNSIQSNRLAQMEVDIDGKGVVNDSIHRPMFLYRLLLGLLPF